MTRYLVTGGAGFIGSHLCERLLADGHEVFVLDDLSTGSIANIAHLKFCDRFHYVVDTVMNRPVTAELVDAADVIFHLAAAVGVRLIIESPVRTIETNVAATELVLALAAKKKRPVFVASTSEVYGNSAEIPFREDGPLVLGAPTKGRWSYACSKALDECLALAYFRERGLPVVVGRLFNTVGPRQTDQYGMVVPTLVRQALAGEPLTVFGDGGQSRCFCHVDDVVAALLSLMIDHLPKAAGHIFNIGSSQEIAIDRLAHLVLEATGSASAIAKVPYEQAYGDGFEDMRRRVPDTAKLRALTGWHPRSGIDKILADVIGAERRGRPGRLRALR